MKRLILCVALLIGAQAAAAEDNYPGYYTIGYSFLKLQDSGAGVSLNLGGITGAVGWMPIKWLGLEATGLLGVGSDNYQGVDFKLESGYMASVLPTLPFGEDWSAYLRVGYLHATLKGSVMGYSATASDHDTAFGGGFQWTPRVGQRMHLGFRVEYTRFLDKDGTKVDGETLSFMQRF